MGRCDFITKLKEGKPEAFDRLYAEYHLPLYRTALLILGNREDAEDVLQETFVTAYLHIHDLRSENGLKSWLFQILTHIAYRAGKKKSREIPMEPGSLGKDQQEQVFYQDNMESRILLAGPDAVVQPVDSAEEIQGRIFRNALQRLDPIHREVLVLYYYDELSVKEIAKICRCLEGTVKSRLYNARKKLMKALEQEGYTEE